MPAVHMILRALSISGDISFTAFLILCKAESWFLDPELDPIMQPPEVWSHLGRIALRFQAAVGFLWVGEISDLYIKIGRNLVNSDGGKSLISQDLPAWINVFVSGGEWGRNYEAWENFSSVIRAVWVPELNTQHKFSDEKEESWALALSALSKVWGFFEHPDLHEFIRLARCTVSTYQRFYYHLPRPKEGSLHYGEVFGSQLAKALLEAGGRFRSMTVVQDPAVSPGNSNSDAQQEGTQPLERVAGFLEALGHKIGTEVEPGEVQLSGSTKHYKDWMELEKHFMAELDNLEASLSESQV
ncbi:hypothetical protein DFH09DRAFT_1125643, partial [Mycena vulgaris]